MAKNLSEDVDLFRMLTNEQWFLVYSISQFEATQGTHGWKEVTFEEDGVIGKGRNKNESTWSIVRGYLEILNDKGSLHSRFYFNKEDGIFVHTDDADTAALSGQRIVRSLDSVISTSTLK